MPPHVAARALIDELEADGIPYELVPHRRTTTARAEAEALGVEPEEIAKTLVLGTSTGPVRVVLPASERLDLRKVRRVLGDDDVELLTEAALADAYPEFELGAVPPIGGEHDDRVLVDQTVRDHALVLLEAGSHDESIRISSADLVRLARVTLADIRVD